MRKLMPKSLLGQVLLAVAGALLVAQAISAVILYRSQQARIADIAATTVSLRVSGFLERENALDDAQQPQSRREMRRAERRERRGGRGAIPVMRSSASPVTGDMARLSLVEDRVGRALITQGIASDAVAAAEVALANDDTALQYLRERPRRFRGREIPETLMLVAIKVDGENDWLTVRIPLPEDSQPRVAPLVLQFVLIYMLLVGALWFLLRRISRPLRRLAGRVEAFASAPGTAEPIPLSGPEDTQRLIAAHNAMEQRIAALVNEKDVMLGAIGHDLRTPLATLRVRIEGITDEDKRKRMAASIEEMDAMLDDILSLARIGRGSDPLERTELSALVIGVVEEFEDLGQPVALLSHERIALPVRAILLRRALRNLIGNAVRYGESAEVTVAREDKHAVISIADHGPGLAESELERMFDPFVRGDPSRNRATGGAGLGLTLANAIIREHGGDLTLKNRDGGGLEAQIRLPIA